MGHQGRGHVATYVDAIRGLAPLVAAHRDAIDRERRLPEAVFAALAAAGLFRLWLPKACGGPELDPLEFLEVVEAAAGLDGSIGWLVGNGGGMSRAGGYLAQGVADEWFADERAFVVAATGAVGTAVVVEGGYRVTGRWPFGSGAHFATRFMGLCADPGAAAPASLCCYMAASDVRVIDNWHVSGLRGTGSCDFVAEDVFVPAAHCHPFQPRPPAQPGLLYRMPQLSMFPWTVSVVPLGIARAALGHAVGIANRKARQGNSLLLRDREVVQSEFGQADAVIRAARAFLAAAMTDLMAAVDIGGEPLLHARATFRQACSHAADSAVRAVDLLARAIGTASLFEESPFERCVRDVQAATKHVAMNPGNYLLAGRVALGLEPSTDRF